MKRKQKVTAQRGAATGNTSAEAPSGPRGNFTPPAHAPEPAAITAPTPEPPVPSSGGSRLAPRNWPLTTRLFILLIIPVVTASIFAGLRVSGSVQEAAAAGDAERVAKLARSATTLAAMLEDERDVSAQPLAQGKANDKAVRDARSRTDQALKQFRADSTGFDDNQRVQGRISSAETDLASLGSLRANAYKPYLLPSATPWAYSEMVRPLIAFANELYFGDTAKLNSRGRSLYSVSMAKASASSRRAVVMSALTRNKLLASDPADIQAATTLEQTGKAEFVSAATKEDVALFAQTVQSADIDAANTYLSRVLATPAGSSLSKQGLRPTQWYQLSSTEIDLMRKVEVELTNQIVTDAGQLQDQAQRDAILFGVAALLAVALGALLTGVTAHQMVRGMRILRSSANDIAETRLPELVDKLSKTDPGRVDTHINPIPLYSRDEFGDVARAFDQVHSEAVRLAAEQALLRGNVNAIFTNLSRRSHGLIQSQLTLITDLENHEGDPDQLESLFKLDHLATRMRRNGENLLVLAGEEPGRSWTQPVPLVDVLRAAAAEVEQYERIELVGIPESEIHGAAVNDLVHLLAELLENATTFSSPQTSVKVTATRLPDARVMVEIHDKGIGLTPEDFADINHKLSNPPTVDASISRRMGLFVVGRLSRRHGIRVQLRPSGEAAGTTSLVMLPEPITHGGAAEPEPEFTVSRVIADQPVPQPVEGLDSTPRTAAELGFDDSRYQLESGLSPSMLDPVGRSLMRQERRAALEAAAQHSDDEPGEFPGVTPPFGQDENAPAPAELFYENREDPFAAPDTADQPYPTELPAEQYGTDLGGQQYSTDFPAEQYGTDLGGEQYGEGGYSSGYSQQAYTPDYAPQEQYPGYGDQSFDHGYGSPYTADAGGLPADSERANYLPEAAADHLSGSPDLGNANAAATWPAATPGADTPSLTASGLPRRKPGRGRSAIARSANGMPGSPSALGVPPAEAGRAGLAGTGEEGNPGGWQAENDEHWQRAAARVREPSAGGVTASGLPRRVPQANLVPGTAEQTTQGGPQVSRAPDEVRGRLTNLRRGIRRGRSAGTDTNGQSFGPNHQER